MACVAFAAPSPAPPVRSRAARQILASGRAQNLKLTGNGEHSRREHEQVRGYAATERRSRKPSSSAQARPISSCRMRSTLGAVRADELQFATVADDDAGHPTHSGGMSVAGSTVPAGPPRPPSSTPRQARLKLRPAARRALLTLHIIAGVGT